MNTHLWTSHFRANLRQFTPPDMPVNGSTLADAVRLPIVRSLAIFQLGESGGGTRLMRYVRHVVEKDQLAGYEEAVGLFIAEEQYHSLLLADLVHYLGGSTLQKQWTNSVFRWLRNRFGIEFNIQILLIAELVAEVYFGMLYRKSSDPVVRTCCHKILADEMRHIAFHTEFLRERLGKMSSVRRNLWRAQFWLCHRLTACVVAWDHQDCFSALKTTPTETAGMIFKTGERFLRRLEKPQSLWLARPNRLMSAESAVFGLATAKQECAKSPQPIT